MTDRPLRAVKAGEKAPPKKRAPRQPTTVAKAASGGSRRQLLVALRARVALAIDDPKTPAPALAALIRQQIEIANAIEAIDKSRKPGATKAKSAVVPPSNAAWDEEAI